MEVVIFGGTGFVGVHYARHILERDAGARVLLCDLLPIDRSRYARDLISVLDDPRCSYRRVDVCEPIPTDLVHGSVDLVVNLAAVHREPGHERHEYWRTNVFGAENVTAYCRTVGCKTILFTSSISPYGISEAPRDELSLPMPSTPYGSSKLVAEKIHLIWQAEDSARKLLIARPGVVFGAGEQGNVTRMVRFLRMGLFAYFGNQDVRKAGIFVKELCAMFDWGLSNIGTPSFCNIRPGAAFYNCTFSPPPSVKEYVDVIREVGGFGRPVLSVPFWLLYVASFLSFGIAGIHPVRVKKLVRSNQILPRFLLENGYPWRWSIRSAFEDWMREKPADWGK